MLMVAGCQDDSITRTEWVDDLIPVQQLNYRSPKSTNECTINLTHIPTKILNFW